jgi:protein-S-isoprenylcysteine O-methyltransferase Ste14
LIAIGRALFRYRSYVPAAVYLAMLVLPRIPFPCPSLLLVSGAVLAACGAALRLWAIRQIGKRARTTGDKARYLITSGPFSLCRNPLYIANILTGCGFCAAFELHLYIPVYIALIGTFYSLVVRYEEALLVEKFGAVYLRYAARTPRWLPVLRIPSSPAGGAFPWDEVIRWERSYFGILLVGVVAVVAKRILT